MAWVGYIVVFLLPLLFVGLVLRRVLAVARFLADARRRAETAGSVPDADAAVIELPPVLEALLRKVVEAKAVQLSASHPELRQALQRARAMSPVAPPSVDTAASGQERWLRAGLLLLVGMGLALLARAL